MNFNYHIHYSYIKCPYCDKNCENDGLLNLKNIEVKVEFECEHCEKKFYADSGIVFNTYSDCKLNGEEHDLKQSEHVPEVYHCENCYYHEVQK